MSIEKQQVLDVVLVDITMQIKKLAVKIWNIS